MKALAICGCITDAAHSVGMSRQAAYDLYNRPAAFGFRRAFDAALDAGMAAVEGGAVERSVKGVARPIFHRGEQVGEYRHYDERLTMFLLRYRRPQRYGAHLDRLPPPPPPLVPPSLDPADEQPDPDEAIGALEFHLGDLVDESELPGGVQSRAHADDGVSFVNFVGNEPPQASLPGGGEGLG